MKFSSLAVLAVVAPFAAGFAPSNQKSLTNVAFAKSSASQLMMSLEDLETKATSGNLKTVDSSEGFKSGKIPSEPKPVKKAGPPKKEKAEKPKPVKAEKPVEAPKEEMPKFEKPVPVKPKKAVAPKKAEKVKADQYIDIPDVKKVEKPRPSPFASKARVMARPDVPKPVPKPKAPVVVEPNALPYGVALGAAPLLLAPLIALSAGRSVLAGTKTRRERIESDIAAAEAAKLKKIKDSAVDPGGLVGAAVRF
jgi:hypothetical protein